MAVATQTHAGQRRMIYGANVGVAVVVACLLTGVVVFLGDRFSIRKDLTQSSVNTLSPRTRQVLGSLDQDVTITGLYAIVTEYDKVGIKRQNIERDMLSVFEGASRKITQRMLDPLKDRDALSDLLKRIREKPAYKDESAPHQKVVEACGPLVADLTKTVRDDAQAMGQLAQNDHKLASIRQFVIIANSFQLILAPSCEDLAEKLENLRTGEIPRWGRAAETLKAALPQIRSPLTESRDWFNDAAATQPDLAAPTKEAFHRMAENYTALLKRIADLQSQVDELKPVKLDQVADALTNAVKAPPIIVETANEARVVSFDEVWEYRQDDADMGPDRDDRVFNGEEALLSAILGVASKEKIGVVFVRYGGESPTMPDFKKYQPGGPLPTAPFIQLSQKLEKLNFKTFDWDLATQKTPPAMENITRSVYVIMPPTPPPPQNPMRPQPPAPSITPEDKQKVFDAIAASGSALFLAESSATRGPMEPYAYSEYLRKTWGIDVKAPYLAIEFTPIPSKSGRYTLASPRAPLLLRSGAFEFLMHPITKPLRASLGALDTVAPLEKYTGEGAPTGVTVEPLMDVKTDNVWAFDDVMAIQQELRSQDGTAPNEKSLRPPFAVAMAAQNDKKQRVVVVGSVEWASDQYAQARTFAQSGDGLIRTLVFPANTDLFTNTLFWLLGDESRIAIGTRTGDVPRLDKLTPGMTAKIWKGFLVAGWPAFALVVGGVVALARRR